MVFRTSPLAVVADRPPKSSRSRGSRGEGTPGSERTMLVALMVGGQGRVGVQSMAELECSGLASTTRGIERVSRT